MTKMTKRLLPALLLAAFAGAASATGFQAWGQSASGIGASHAGSAAIADNAGTLYYNPAGMTLLPGRQISLGMAGVRPRVEFRDGSGDAGQWAALPNAYLSWQVADRWFASITVDTQDLSHLPKAENQGAVGVDLGVSALATLSTGEVIAGPKAHRTLLKRLRRLSRSLSRKQKGSANAKKARARLARLHARIASIRQDALHQLTTSLTRRFPVIGIEDLNVSGMMRNRRLARSIADMGLEQFA